ELGLFEDGLRVAYPGDVIHTGQFHQLGSGYALSEIATVSHVEPPLIRPVKDEGRHCYARKDVSHIDLRVHAHQGGGHAWAGGGPQVSGPPGPVALFGERGRVVLDPPLTGLPRTIDPGKEIPELFLTPAPGIVAVREPPRIGAIDDER